MSRRIVTALGAVYAIMVTWYLVEHVNVSLTDIYSFIHGKSLACSVLISAAIGSILDECLTDKRPTTRPPLTELTVNDLPIIRQWVEVPDEAILEIEEPVPRQTADRFRKLFQEV